MLGGRAVVVRRADSAPRTRLGRPRQDYVVGIGLTARTLGPVGETRPVARDGTTRLEDPYWGTSERDSSYSHHWTDGQGNYRASNDASFNPNVGAGGGATWQRMGPAR